MSMGVLAAERCDDFGWHPRGRIDPSLVAEVKQYPRFGVGHAWSRSAAYSLTQAPNRMYIVFTLEGGFEFDVDGSPVVADPHSLVLFDGAAPTTARTLTETARYVWYLEPSFLQPGRSRFSYGEPVRATGTAISALMQMTNVSLGTPGPGTGAAARHLALSLEHLLAGTLADAGKRQLGTDTRHEDGLFMAAQLAIQSNFRDHAFNVSRLARELSVSVRTVHETFSRMGTTPRREIERARLNEAERLRQSSGLLTREIAERAGFSSAKQLARALHRTDADPLSTAEYLAY